MLLSCLLLMAATAIATATTDSPRLAQSQFDAHRLQTGQFTYRDTKNGQVEGQGTISIRRQDAASYRFANLVTGTADQHWQSIASTTLAPLSAELTFGSGPDRRKAFELNYSNGHVSGFATDRRAAVPKTPKPVSAAIDTNTVDQRIDWAAVMALDLNHGTRFGFHVYDPSTGSSEVRVEVSPPSQLQVPAGTYNAYTITYWVRKSTGAERYIVYATDSLPRFMVREDFPDGSISELTEKR